VSLQVKQSIEIPVDLFHLHDRIDFVGQFRDAKWFFYEILGSGF